MPSPSTKTRSQYFAHLLCISIGLTQLAMATQSVSINTPEYRNQPALATIKAIEAYNQGYSANGVKIGILDGGFNPHHFEFDQALSAGFAWQRTDSDTTVNNWVSVQGPNFKDFLNEYSADAETLDTHGSFVASVIAGRLDGANRPNNIMGVAYNAKLVYGRLVFSENDAEGLNDAQWAETIDFVSSQGVRVINNSWGTDSDWHRKPIDDYTTYLQYRSETLAALKRAQDRNAVIVFAAGNNSVAWPGLPGALPLTDNEIRQKGGWIVVAATTVRGVDPAHPDKIEMAQTQGNSLSPIHFPWDGYTNFCGDAKAFCISAPGGFLLDSGPTDRRGVTGAAGGTNDKYDEEMGTSFSAPIVTGAVALVAEKYPWMTNKNLATTILTTGSTAANPSAVWGRGLLDVGKAIQGPGIFEEDFEANVTADPTTSYIFSNNISGSAGIKKLGLGTLALTGQNTYTGNTYLNGGTLLVSSLNNLGNSRHDLLFDGGTLKFGANFDLTRNLTIGAGGGRLDLNGYLKKQTFDISGQGQFGVMGGGSLTLNRTNTQKGGTFIGGGSNISASANDQLGAPDAKLTLDAGNLHLDRGFGVTENYAFIRPIDLGANGGTIYTLETTYAYIGGLIGSVAGPEYLLPTLNFVGTPFVMGADLKLNALWDGDLTVPIGMTLSGKGGPTGHLYINGNYSPGNSPGTSFLPGSVTFNNASVTTIEIDGPGTGNGAGNYDRIILTNNNSTFTADGTLSPVLRGISAPANNNYTPPLGYAYTFVSAPGGVLGSFTNLVQPAAGLLPGTRFDTVYGNGVLTLYPTPLLYRDLNIFGLTNNAGQTAVGTVLDRMRPTAGIRVSDPNIKGIFDNLAPETLSSLPSALDRFAGVAYADLIRMSFENNDFLLNEIMQDISTQRHEKDKTEAWLHAIARSNFWRNDGLNHSLRDESGGMIVGVPTRFMNHQSQAGVAFAYVGGTSKVSEALGSGSLNNMQLMAYLSHQFNDHYYLQGTAGAGGGYIRANRWLFDGLSYSTPIHTANLAVGAITGWHFETPNAMRYEAGIGMNYQAMHHFGFSDSGQNNFMSVNSDSGSIYSAVGSLQGSISTPIQFTPTQYSPVHWRAMMFADFRHNFLDTHADLSAHLQDQSYIIQGGKIGRDRRTLGFGLSGNLSPYTRIAFELSNQSAAKWDANALVFKLNLNF